METIQVLPIRVRVTAVLRKALLSGEYQPGEELSLTEMAAKLGVSRTPVREAFQSLAAEGLLELRMNRGAIVTGIDEKFIQDHFQVRILLEGEAAARAAENAMDTRELTALQQWAQDHRDTMSEQEYQDYNQQFHTAIWRAADNGKLFQLLTSLWNGPSSATQQRDREHEALSIQEHRQILEWIDQSREERARAAMEGHISRSMGNILFRFRQTRKTAGGERTK